LVKHDAGRDDECGESKVMINKTTTNTTTRTTKAAMNKWIIRALVAAALAGLGTAAGCATDKSEPKDFFPMDEQRKVQNIADVQAANGAREDATLQPYHFTGGKLNSLGQEKLAKIVPDELEDDTVVYLNLPETAEKTAARRDDVMAYLKSLGVSEEHAKINLGTNPELAHPAEEGLTRLAKTETGATTSTDVAANAPATEGTGMGGMSNGTSK
jgi:hypothetical protein